MMPLTRLDAIRIVCLCAVTVIGVGKASAQAPGPGQKWAASWAGSAHGPYPSGNASAQPDLSFVIGPSDTGASDQTFRLMVRPDLWGRVVRLRLTNAFGTKPVTFDDLFVGLQASGGNIASGTNRGVSFNGGKTSITVAAGEFAYSDPVALSFVTAADDPLLTGRRLAVSFHVAGVSGPMTWHAKAITTSYLTGPGGGSHGREESDAAFPYPTTSWFFLDAVEVVAPANTVVIACFGDSITDGTASTLNGDDRWPDVFSRRMHARFGARVSVVNAGIGGNRVLGPAAYTPAAPSGGGPSALDRLDRDVLSLSGLSAVIWFEGINDIANGAAVEDITSGLRAGVMRMRVKGSLRLYAATITPTLGNAGAHGTAAADATRQAVNRFLTESRIFDGVIDFDVVTRDPSTGGLKTPFVPNSTVGGAGDKLHPNRAGYQAMGTAVNLDLFAPLFDK